MYLPRLVDRLLIELLDALPGVLVVGARATGKTTTAARHAAGVVHLDRDSDAEQFRADPDVALERELRRRPGDHQAAATGITAAAPATPR